MEGLTVVLTARRLSLFRSFEAHFGDLPWVSITDKDIVSIEGLDAVVSPANAFGWMDGGVDQVFVYAFGQQIEDRVQATIKARYDGKMPVGQAFVIDTQHPKIPWLVVSPTMEIPGLIRGTRNPFEAFKAALEAVLEHNRRSPQQTIQRVGFTGMGTGTGGIPGDEAAQMMREALDAMSSAKV